ncbi:hypothetical protein VCRA2126O85_170083 [Vibrio crassostreae]|nr:hypothetical protein VCRA2126O85_170083 [Vibrio crassostreae]CAK2856562.1 hypothetical protein VCRA2128O100_320021 [Vibrio crassostreae]CAK2856911.1 hypothetical protein VCRA2128O106_300049 [Vibrio crassostreae]CAK2858373.1 hypothetical protein VCRA2125O83_300020 [Vibrio crassostreae]CAK2868544.1 hypothetical protein VCRA2127O91_320049 [Vibrio crassostreae]
MFIVDVIDQDGFYMFPFWMRA